MIIAQKSDFEFIGPDQKDDLMSEEEIEQETDDLLDFNMM